MRPFSPGFITARIVYPILLGIILLSTVQLPTEIVSAMADFEPHPTIRDISHPTMHSATGLATYSSMRPTTNAITISSKRNIDDPTFEILAGPGLKLPFIDFCSWPPGSVVTPIPGQNSVGKKIPPSKTRPDKGKLDTGPKHPKVAIIIDDVGYTDPGTEEMVMLPIIVTWAILPDTPYGREYLALAREKKVEVMLHLPLESVDGSVNPGPGVIQGSWDEKRIIDQLDHDLAAVPGVVGVNNHMGSLGTQDRRLMDLIMKTLRRKKLFFVDSRTTAKTVARESAGKYGVTFAQRRVFIDNDPDIQLKKSALRNLIAVARKEGSAIGILHIRNGNAAAIASMLPEFAAAGIEFVPASQLAR